MIEWNNDYSVGVEVFDEHHRKLFDIFNRLADCAKEGEEDGGLMEEIISELIDYADYHFKEEEQALKETGYPGLDTQVREHEDFLITVNVFRSSYEYDVVPPTSDVMEFLVAWLENHIKITDKAYESFMKEAGPK